MSGMTCGDMNICFPHVWDGEIPKMLMTLIQWEREVVRGFGKGKRKGDGSCHTCGQFGHWSRECPSNPKGGGKGKGFGKGRQGPNQVGNGRGKGKGFDGKGKDKDWGYQGTCFNCGKVGHKECVSTWAALVSEVAEEIIGSVEVGGVWVVACVEKVVVPNKPQQQHVKFATKVQNKYQRLSDDDDEDECI